jgi:polyribonucleotide nucleotidyltransferase
MRLLILLLREFWEETGIKVKTINSVEDPVEDFSAGTAQVVPFAVNYHWISRENYKKRCQALESGSEAELEEKWKKGCEKHFNFSYLAEATGSLDFHECVEEVDGIAWFTEDEIDKLYQNEEIFGAEVPAEEVEAKEALVAKIKAKYDKDVHDMVIKKGTLQETGMDALIEKIVEEVNADLAEDEAEITVKEISSILQDLMKKEARRMILEDGSRPDGRTTEQIRPIWSEVDLLPRVHGSAMFKRGATQGLTTVTLADPSLGQLIEDISGERTNNYIHHYNMPPYASGEAGRFGFPKRREIGHGALAERALFPMIPSQEEFPYTIRVVTEIMSSNGSTSQAAVCGSTLSLMAAGVPIKRPVSGIAMGLMSDGEKFIILSDIQGLEDHVGDMDFKVAGSKEGITAIQMDIKLKGIPKDILIKALGQAKVGRMHIMTEMLKAIETPRNELSQYAPKVAQVTIPAEKIGAVIGSGGSVIKDIIEKSGAEVNVEEDKENALGIINISSPDQEAIDKAAKLIDDITREVVVGDEFEGTVTRVEGYGIFVEYLTGREGLVHVSNMAVDFVKDANELYKIGDTVSVRVKEFNPEGKIALTMLTPEQEAEQKEKRASRPPRDNNRGGGRRNYDRNSRGGRSNSRRSESFGRGPRR